MVNGGLTRAFDVALAPLLWLPPLAGLFVVSLLTAMAALLVVGRTSDQKRMVETKRQIHAALFEIRLFNDDLVAVLRALGEVLRHNALYLRLSLVPLAWMAFPLTIVIAHLQAFYLYTGLQPGTPAILTVELGRTTPGTNPSTRSPALEAPPEVRVDTPAVYLPATNEILWRIVPTTTGAYTLTVRVGDQTATKSLRVAQGPARRSPRASASLLDQVLYPSEPPLPAAGDIAGIAIAYPEAAIDVLGWRVHWLVVYIALSMALAFLLAGRLGVTI
jgi:hypothetical protein